MGFPGDRLLASEEKLHAAIAERDSKSSATRTRVLAVYDSVPHILTEMGVPVPSPDQLELGYYDGFQLKKMKEWSGRIKGVDVSSKYDHFAKGRKEIKPFIQSGEIELMYGDAMNLPFDDNMFTSVTGLEVLGVGLDYLGENITNNDQMRGAVKLVISEASRVLKPKGVFIFSVKNPSLRFLGEVQDFTEGNGVSIYHDEIEATCREAQFERIDSYGQVTFRKTRSGWYLPRDLDLGKEEHLNPYDPKVWIPERIIDKSVKQPLYWIFAAQKAA